MPSHEQDQPEFIIAAEAARILRCQRSNLGSVLRRGGVREAYRTPVHTYYDAAAIRALAEVRANAERAADGRVKMPREPRVCAKHGDEDMRNPPSGRYCAVCNRERKRERDRRERALRVASSSQ